ncbi:hypothetical protein WJX81_000331 [Elliptochloris bilobata]|uniref:MPN domain-containing protein n=1 Tax=Elliptochloris bilobata TaxID=381761 RepID=A0AAW1S780_9CHLO
MSPAYTVDSKALLKILLHAAKHPSHSVNGVLLGSVAAATGEPGSPRESAAQPAVTIVDAIPLFHSFLSLAPALEAALFQVDTYARQRGCEVVGYYHANERLTDLELGPVARKIADRIQQRNQHACALLVDNAKLGSFVQQKSQDVLQLWTREGGARGWSRAGGGSGGGSGSSARLQAAAGAAPLFMGMHGEGRHTRLHDFDDHLNDLSIDWINADLV